MPFRAKTPPLLLGIDLGASSLKASLVTPDHQPVASAGVPIETHIPHPGWSEQDPAHWYRALCRAVRTVLAGTETPARRLAAVAVSAGAHIPVLLNARNEPVRPAILWNDQRSRAQAEALHARAGELIIQSSLNRVNPTWSLAMLQWLREHEPETVAQTHRLCLAKDYLRLRLTDSWATDFGDVVGALLADAATGDWAPRLCALIDWPTATLPPVLPSTSVAGAVTKGAAADTGLPAGTPVVVGSIDTTVELFGVGAMRPDQGVIKLASAGVLSLIVDRPLVNPPISCYPHLIDGLYYTATGTNSCASAQRWFRDQLFAPGTATGQSDEASYTEMDRLAATIPAGAAGLLFHPYLQGERAPHWDSYLRANFVGITMRHTRAHFCRAVYEGLSFSIRDALEAARAVGQGFEHARLIGGGARSPIWRQILSDVTGLTLETPRHGDASFGAALLAGVGIGLVDPDPAAIEDAMVVDHQQLPDPRTHAFYRRLFELYTETRRALEPLDYALHELPPPPRRIAP